MSIVVAILVFGAIIFIHELGHFLVAKKCDVKINEFAIGMGPKIFKIKKGETLYSVRLFPIGGFVAMEGEDENSDDNRSVSKKPVSKRIAITVAGAVMNLLLGLLAVVILTMMSDEIFTTNITYFSENALSHETGLELNDKILRVNGGKIYSDIDLTYFLQSDDNGVYDIEVLRNGEKVVLNNVQLATQNYEDGTKSYIYDFKIQGEKKNIANVMSYSVKKTYSIGRIVWMSLGDIITGNFKMNQLSGPVGIVSAIDTAIDTDQGQSFKDAMSSLLLLLAMITVNVGIFNLLPIPALDGGRLVFLIIEAIRRKPINPEREGMVHFVGFAILIVTLIIVSFNDIIKLF